MTHTVDQLHVSIGTEGTYDGALRCRCGVGLCVKADTWAIAFTQLVAGFDNHKAGKVYPPSRLGHPAYTGPRAADPSP